MGGGVRSHPSHPPAYAPAGYVDSTKVIYIFVLERKDVFRDVRIKSNLDMMWLVSAVWKEIGWERWGKICRWKQLQKYEANGISWARINTNSGKYGQQFRQI